MQFGTQTDWFDLGIMLHFIWRYKVKFSLVLHSRYINVFTPSHFVFTTFLLCVHRTRLRWEIRWILRWAKLPAFKSHLSLDRRGYNQILMICWHRLANQRNPLYLQDQFSEMKNNHQISNIYDKHIKINRINIWLKIGLVSSQILILG